MAFTGTATKNLGLPQWNPQDHPSFLTDINDAWNKIDENAGQVASEMEGVPEQLEQLQALTQSLNEDVSQNTAGLQNLEVRVGNVEAEAAKVSGMQVQIAAAERNIAENSSDIAAAQRDIASAETSIAANTTKIEEVENAIELANGNITTNSNAIATNKNDIGGAIADINVAKEDITNIKLKLEGATTAIPAIRPTFTSSDGIGITPTIYRLGQLIRVSINEGKLGTPGRTTDFAASDATTANIKETLKLPDNFAFYNLRSSPIYFDGVLSGYAYLSKDQNGPWCVNVRLNSGANNSPSRVGYDGYMIGIVL